MKTPKYIRGSYNIADRKVNEVKILVSNTLLFRLKQLTQRKKIKISECVRQAINESYEKMFTEEKTRF
jgi:hypothetical protein